jgi:TrmH family RNA methyltransferase
VIIAEMITSTQNPRIQWVRRLQSKSKTRQADNVFIIEGVRLIEEAQSANWGLRYIFFTETLGDRGKKLVDTFLGSETKLELVSANVMQAISDTKNPQGILAVVAMKSLPVPDQLDFVLILDRLRDPGNMGAILRTAAAAKVQAVLLTTGSVDVYSPKVLRAGMGAQFRMPIQNKEWIEIKTQINNANLHTFLATSDGKVTYHEAEFQRPLALIIGGEADGVSDKIFQSADSRVMIPMPGGGDSLNAAVAAGILLFEIARQRESKP